MTVINITSKGGNYGVRQPPPKLKNEQQISEYSALQERSKLPDMMRLLKQPYNSLIVGESKMDCPK